MAQLTIKLKEALEFAKKNGYILAVYKKQDDNYVLFNEAYMSDIAEDTDIIVKTTGACTDFNEFITEDKQYCFRLHNNFNVPKIIPIIEQENSNISKCYHCDKPVCFERHNKDLPEEYEVCSECDDHVCNDCVDWKFMGENDMETPICKKCAKNI